MITFTIEPYVGPLPLRFGMTPSEVEAIVGKPDWLGRSHFGNRHEGRPNVNMGYGIADERLEEVVFAPGANPSFEGRDLFMEPDPIGFLRGFDDSPFEWVGFIIFLELGIRVSGYHDNDESQRAFGVVKTGIWDEYIGDFVRYK